MGCGPPRESGRLRSASQIRVWTPPGQSTETPTFSASNSMPQRFADGDHGVFRRGVDADRQAARRHQAGERSGVDDVRLAFLAPHAGEERLQAIDHAHDVDVHDPAPVVLGGVGEVAESEHARVVAKQVDGAEALEDLVRQRFHGVGVSDVGLDGEAFDLGRADFAGNVGGGSLLDIGEDDVHALGRGRQGDAASDAAATAGHNGDLGPLDPAIDHSCLGDAPMVAGRGYGLAAVCAALIRFAARRLGRGWKTRESCVDRDDPHDHRRCDDPAGSGDRWLVRGDGDLRARGGTVERDQCGLDGGASQRDERDACGASLAAQPVRTAQWPDRTSGPGGPGD